MDEFDIGVDWLSPVSDTEPSGRNTEYDTKFAELETAAIATQEQQYGDTVIAGQDPDWPRVLRLASELSQQTRDLRVLLLMTRALTRLHGLPGMLYGIRSVHSSSREFWESLHPQLEIDDEQDPQMRFSALCNFGDSEGLAADLRQSVVLSSHLGIFTVRDLERLLESGAIEVDGTTVTDTQLAQIVDELRKSGNTQALDLPTQITEEINALNRIYQERLDSEYQPDFSVLLRPLQKIIRMLDDETPASAIASTSNADGQSSGKMAQGGDDQAVKGIGSIQSRRDAVRQLELICRYFEINEPTNPAPFLIRRAMKIMEMNFMDILKDMAPDGLNQASFITGVEPSQEG